MQPVAHVLHYYTIKTALAGVTPDWLHLRQRISHYKNLIGQTTHRELAIEASAIAIRDTFGNRSNRAKRWEDLPDKLKNDYRAEAEAALEAAGCLPDR